MTIQSAIQLFGGIGIFLFAIRLISDSLQLLAGDRMRGLIAMLTRTPLLGVLVGTASTVLIQSSSATTVMTVSFVDAGLMTLNQAIGVIMGANIGTTVTGQILAINIKSFTYVFIVIGIPLTFFCKSKFYQYIGNGLIGFGLLFIGMQTMESSMSFLRTRQDIFLTFSDHPLLGLLAGTLLTFLVQSSSATVGLTIALGMQGLLPLEAAIPIILGDNIGTTVTAVLAAIGTNRAAKQACAAHVLFNVIGVCIFLPLMPFYIGLIMDTADSIGHQIANAHSLFNICNTLVFLPFVGIFASLIRKIIPDRPRQALQDAQYLDPRLIEVTPGIAVQAVKNECLHMGEMTLEMLDTVEGLFFEHKEECREQAQVLEDRLDNLHKAILAYGDDILSAGIADDAAARLRAFMACSGDLERIGDSGTQLLDFYTYRRTQEHDFSPEAMRELSAMFSDTRMAVRKALTCLVGNQGVEPVEVEALAAHVREMEADLRIMHVERLSRGICHAETGLIFIDVLGVIEHVAYRARKIARASSAAKARPAGNAADAPCKKA